MKPIKEIINQEPVYIGEFKNKNDVIREFEDVRTDEELEKVKEKYLDINILFAVYDVSTYGKGFVVDGSAFVLFEKDGKLFEVNGGHCSCYGLEGQWEPEEVVLEELEHRLTKGKFFLDEELKTELCKFLGVKY